jgi:DNA-binding NarL/FixJ family response regulator
MEPITAVILGILTIIGSGSLTKVGENITDGTGNLAQKLWVMLKRKAPDTQTVRLLDAGQKIDYEQAVIDLELIANDTSDLEVAKLLDAVRSILSSNQELAAKVGALQAQLSQSKSQNSSKLAEKIGIVIQGGGKSDIETFNM